MTPVLPRNKVSPSSRALRPSSKSLVGPHTNQLRNCGSRVADPPERLGDWPTQVCCKASLAKAKAEQRGSHDGARQE